MKIISFIYKRTVVEKILVHLNVYKKRKNQGAPLQILKEDKKPVVKIVPYDDGWPEYDEPVFDCYKKPSTVAVYSWQGTCPRMPFFSNSSLFQKTMLAGKRRLQYQTYGCAGCASFFEMLRFKEKCLFSDNLLGTDNCNHPGNAFTHTMESVGL